MRKYRLGTHTKSNLKVHVVWLSKYRNPVLTGEMTIRTRDLIRQIAMVLDLEIISGKEHATTYTCSSGVAAPWKTENRGKLRLFRLMGPLLLHTNNHAR
jgi:hypothetical protein